MKKYNFNKKGNALIGIIIVLVVAGLISGGLYYYLSKQIPEAPGISEKLVEGGIVKPDENAPSPEEKPEEELPKEEITPEEKIEEKPAVQKCVDGTPYDQCSVNKPKYCDNGNLTNSCSICGCPYNQQCQTDGSCITYIEGFVLVKKGSVLEVIAEKVALDKGWIILKTSGINPEKIREEILQFTSGNEFKYMLIIGDFAEIPTQNRDLLSSFLKSQGLEFQNPYYDDVYHVSKGVPLDSLYYGNIDDDPFVELSVGRLPFSSEEEVKNYYRNLRIEKNIETINIVRVLGILGPIGIPSIKIQFMNYNVDNFLEAKSISKTTIQKYLTESDIFEYHTHGNDTSFVLGAESFLSADIPDLSSNNPIILAGVCHNANELGKEFLKQGASAFFGFIHEGPHRNVFPFRPREIGQSIGEALKETVNEDIVRTKVNKITAYFSPNYILYGDPSIKIDYQQKTVAEKAKPIKTSRGLEIIIPKYKQLSFYIGDYEFIYFFIDFHSHSWRKKTYETLKSEGYISKQSGPESEDFIIRCAGPSTISACNDLKIMGYSDYTDIPFDYGVVTSASIGNFDVVRMYIFKIDEDYRIREVYEEIDGNKMELSKYATYGIVKGNKEKYLYILESPKDYLDLLINDGFLNGRKIILELYDK